MIEDHIAHVKARFGAPVYVSKRGDVLVDAVSPIIASAREIALNGEAIAHLWSVRFGNARGRAETLLQRGDWVQA